MSTGTVFRVFRHPEPLPMTSATDEDGTVLARLSFRHLDEDPICSGAQVAEDTERVA